MTEYDSNGNEIHYKYSSGFEAWKEYDKNDILIHFRDSAGAEQWYWNGESYKTKPDIYVMQDFVNKEKEYANNARHRYMKITAISDTHTKHGELDLPGGDVLIHAGDFMSSGKDSLELLEFLNWLSQQPYEHKILIAGNHDRLFEEGPEYAMQLIDDVNHDGSITYLQDNGCEIDGVKFWGTPWTPAFYEWAFQLYGDDGIKKFAMIPDDIDVLVSHGPMYGMHDEITTGLLAGATPGHIGCKHLKKAIERVNPKLHVCGHIHSGQGIFDGYGEITTHINAACLGESYDFTNDKRYFEWTLTKS